MITISINFDDIPQAHAALGNMMARMTTAAPADNEVGSVTTLPAEPQGQSIGRVEPEPEAKPKRKRGTGNPTGRPKGSKDGPGVVRKGTKKAAEGLDIDVLRERLQAYAGKHSFKAARDLLASYNIKKLPELAEDQYFAFDRDMAKAPEAAA